MNELPELQCPECDAWFCVVWSRSPETCGGPEYCPFCGDEMDYTKAGGEA